MSRRERRAGGEPISGAHLREAERGFLALLRAKRFPRAWVEKNAIDLLAQAASEYAAWLKGHKAEPNPVGWLITCAYRRAINLLDSESRRPPTTSIDAVVDHGDQRTPTPEQEALANDRQRVLREAMHCLPAKDRRLISLVYFEDRSVREAGRRLGWRKSAADRHHNAALERLRQLVGDDRALLSPGVLGLGAWVAHAEDSGPGLGRLLSSAASAAHSAGASAVELARRLAAAARRMLPLAEPGSAAASAGAGRVAGVCGAGLAAAVCGLLVVGVRPPLPGGDGGERPARPHVATPKQQRATSMPAPVQPRARGESESAGSDATPSSSEHVSASRRGTSSPTQRPAGPASQEAAEQVVEEFGVEHESAPSTSAAESTPDGAGSSGSPSHPASRPRRASGAQVNEEFGL